MCPFRRVPVSRKFCGPNRVGPRVVARSAQAHRGCPSASLPNCGVPAQRWRSRPFGVAPHPLRVAAAVALHSSTPVVRGQRPRPHRLRWRHHRGATEVTITLALSSTTSPPSSPRLSFRRPVVCRSLRSAGVRGVHSSCRLWSSPSSPCSCEGRALLRLWRPRSRRRSANVYPQLLLLLRVLPLSLSLPLPRPPFPLLSPLCSLRLRGPRPLLRRAAGPRRSGRAPGACLVHRCEPPFVATTRCLRQRLARWSRMRRLRGRAQQP